MTTDPTPDDLVRAVRAEACSPERAALLIARDANPTLDIGGALAAIDRLAEPLAELPATRPPEEHAQALSGHLGDRLGFRGDTDNYYDPRNSYLDQVLERRRGLPIALSVIYAAVGRRAGVEVDGIAFPGHFLARVGGSEGVYIDPFRGGRQLSDADLKRLAVRVLGSKARVTQAHLAPVGVRPLAVRMLLNLKNAHERRGDQAARMLVCDRLVDLTDAATMYRDRGLAALALGARAQAAADLTTYLERQPEAADRGATKAILARLRGQVAVLS